MNLPIDTLRRTLAACRGNILDLRDAAGHAAGHLPGSFSLPCEPELAGLALPVLAGWLDEHLPSIYLPPRHEPLLVVAERNDLAAAVACCLSARGRESVQALGLDARDVAALPADLRRRGRSPDVLWRPPAFLRRWVHLLPPPAAGPVLDLACGAGRAAVWLARLGWQVTGVDHQPEALALAARLAARSGVRLDLRPADLRRPSSLPPGPWAAILLLRFLDRELVRRVPACLRRGGVVMLETFRDAPGYIGNPQPRHRLRAGEAACLWRQIDAAAAADMRESAGPELLVYEEGFAGDGKPVAGVVGRWAAPSRRGAVT